MHPCTPAAKPATATQHHDGQPFTLIDGHAVHPRSWPLPQPSTSSEPAPDSFFGSLEPLQQRRHLAGRRAVQRHADDERCRRLQQSTQALLLSIALAACGGGDLEDAPEPACKEVVAPPPGKSGPAPCKDSPSGSVA